MSSIKLSVILPVLILSFGAMAQDPDSLTTIDLREVEVQATPERRTLERLPAIDGTIINTGKKNEVLKLTAMDADLSTNNARQVFAKVPGVTIWESDGSGLQVGVATRGLSPNRSWEFNVRQNGSDISAEPFGYPEAYYNPPMEGVERIEIVRGAASLQYGPQFGGSLNYVMKKGVKDKAVSIETRQTVGSYGLFNSYNAIGGTKGRLSYYAFLHHRNADGWRENSRYDVSTVYGSISYALSERTSLGAEHTHYTYQSQQPGGLTDALFATDARRSLRSRNWFSTPWNVSALQVDHAFNKRTKLNARIFATHAQRNSVGFLRSIDVADGYDPEIGSFAGRQVDRDEYANYGAEVRMLHDHTFLGRQHHLSVGIRSYKGNTDRRQQGAGSTGDDLDLGITGDPARTYQLGTLDHAVFVENRFQLTDRWSIVPGARYEMIVSTVDGTGNGLAIEDLRQRRDILLFGAGTEFRTTSNSNIYASYSQAYRPILYSQLIPSGTTMLIDPDLKDASGHNIDLGFRGGLKQYLIFDVGVFHLLYDGRIGTVSRDGIPFRTNIGTSVSQGVEAYVEWDPVRTITPSTRFGSLKLFLSYSNIDARYTRWDDPAGIADPERSLVGNRVENSPEVIARYGATYAIRRFSFTFQGSDVGAIYTDALNTEAPNAAATIGKLAGYRVMDISATWCTGGGIELRGGVNNIADERYATRRAGGYPGPGIMPANGRTAWLSIGARF